MNKKKSTKKSKSNKNEDLKVELQDFTQNLKITGGEPQRKRLR